MKRQRYNDEEYYAKLEEQDGVCAIEGCTVAIDLEGDHAIPYFLTRRGKPDQLICKAHHLEKTKRDITVIAKTKRRQKKRWGPKKSGGFRGWRRFDGSVVIRK